MPGNRSGDTGGESVGARIRVARLDRKYTQSQLAGTDFSISYISAIERGQIQPSLRALEIIAQRLGLPSSHFFQNTPIPYREGREMISSHPERLSALTGLPALAGNHRHVVDINTQVEYTILEARILLEQQRSEEAIALLDKLRAQSHDPRVQMRISIQLGQAYLDAGNLHECELALVEAEKLAIRLNDPYARLRICYRIGLTYAALHQFDRAVETHRQCLEMLDELQHLDPFWRFDIYYQLGSHYTQLRQDEIAFSMFQQAADLAKELEHANHTQKVFGELSQHLAQENYLYRSLLYAHKSIQEHTLHIDTAFMADLFLHLGQAALEREHGYDHAGLEKLVAQHPAQPLLQAAILITLADWQRSHDQLALAEQTAQLASTLTLLSGDSHTAAEAQFMQGRIAYAQGRSDAGAACCAAALEMLQRLGLSHELADHALEYATDLEQRGKTAEALHYMKLAFETRRRIGL